MSRLINAIRAFNGGREPERLAMKYARMRSNPAAFMRGTAHLFSARLPRASWFHEAPLVWSCGDLHMENFGSYMADNRLVHFGINDFDDALQAPASFDLLRLMSSVLVSAEGLGFDADATRALCREAIDLYAEALLGRQALWVERETASGLVGDLLEDLRSRTRAEFLDTRTDLKGKRRSLRIDGEKALAITGPERARLDAFMRNFMAGQPEPGFFRLIDAARRISGNGSLGVDRYILLVRGEGSPDGNYLLDLKEARPSGAVQAIGAVQTVWATEAERVVQAQRCMQANSIALLHALQFDGKPFVLRELQPAQDRVAIAACKGRMKRFAALVKTQAAVLAWAQLRASGHFGTDTGDALAAYGEGTRWRRLLLGLAVRCAEQVRTDWKTYAAAYDAGAFSGQ